MTPSEIMPGMKFNHWKVIKFDHTNKHRVKYFLCECDVCGKQKPVRGISLTSGESKACSKQCTLGTDITGQKFGRWTVISKDKSKPQYYICECECGTRRSVYGSSLRLGRTLSCGCLKAERAKEKNLENAKSHIGEKYGWLTITGYELRGKDHYYHCKCDCGNEVTAIGKNIFFGNTLSCGCMNSKANEMMDKILRKHHVSFAREYKFSECADKRPLPFDFAIFDPDGELIGLIENNGSLHYSTSGTGWDTPERLIKQQKHDYLKRKFAEDNGIPFLVIPYQYFNDIEKFLTTSDFWKIVETAYQ